MSNVIETTRWLDKPKANSRTRLRLICFPFAGGGKNIFRGWAGALPESVEVIPVQLPGRDTRIAEQPYSEAGPLVESIGRALAPHLNFPYAFFGHSMGAALSFELARHLRRNNMPGPVHLFVSGRRAPQLPDADPPIHTLPHDEFIAELRRFNGTPQEVLESPELMELLLPMLRADFALCETYVYHDEPPLDCSISVYGGLSDPDIDRELLLPWREQTTQNCVVRMLPGDHFFLQSEKREFLQMLAKELHVIVAGLAAMP